MTVELPANYQPSESEAFMNPLQVQYFRGRLEQARAALRQELEGIPQVESQDGSREGDQTDLASADTERDFELRNRERIQTMLRQTDQALARLENGTFGICEDTGEPIGLRRLMAQPTTALSLEAQVERERQSGP
jgi:DnaK suppressor protein